MSDILSGGAIDASTDGPIPPNTDDRSRDVLEEQRIRQEQEAIGGTQFPPTTEPLPPIADPASVVPPQLPDIGIPSFAFDFAGDETREIARQAAIDVLKRVTIDGQSPIIEGSSISFSTSRNLPASEDFGIGGSENSIQASLVQRGADAADFENRSAIEDKLTANSFAIAEAKSFEKRTSANDFDRESDIRQRGETLQEFRERQELLREERSKIIEAPDVLDNESVLTRDISGPIAVSLNRADGQGKVFAFFRSENSSLGEPTLPPNEYYVGGGEGGGCIGLALYTKTEGTPPNTTQQVWIGAGAIAFEIPLGFDPSEGKFIASSGSGYVWAEIEISQETGEVISRNIRSGESEPSGTKTKYYYTLGYYEYEEDSPNVINYGCGSIDVAVCRNWFAIQPDDYYRVFMARSS